MDGLDLAPLIGAPGLYEGIPADRYHGQLTVAPSLSASMAVTLVDECPAKVFANCYLDPEYERQERTDFDLGTAAHLGLLEPHLWAERIVEIDADSYRTNAAKAQRDAAYAAGKVPLLTGQAKSVLAMGAAARRNAEICRVMEGARFETTLVWQDRETGVWCKTRPDILAVRGDELHDYKTTSCAEQSAFERRAADLLYFQKAAWYLDGVAAVTGRRPEVYGFIVQETTRPFLTAVHDLDERAIEWGRKMNRAAIDLFAECLETGIWPGYGATRGRIGLPAYTDIRLEQRAEAGEFKRRPPIKKKPDACLLRASERAQAPL